MTIGLSSVDHLPFVPKSEFSNKSNDTSNEMEFSYESFVKEEIVDEDEDVDQKNEIVNNNNNNDVFSVQEPAIVQQPQFLKTTPRTVVISPKQSHGPITVSKHLSKPVFIPINLSNVKTIKVSSVCIVFFFFF